MWRVELAALIAVTASLVLGGVASANANPTASCLGVGSSANAGYPGDRATISHEIKDFAIATGTTPGKPISDAARLHLGTPSDCFGG